MASTGAERILDMVRFKHHAITIPHLTPAEKILEAARQLDSAIKQHPKKAPMEKLVAIEIIRNVLLGERKEKLPPNSVQVSKTSNTVLDPETSSSNQVRRSKDYRRKTNKMAALYD